MTFRVIPALHRFREKAVPVTESGCWLYTGSTRHGYGVISISHMSVQAHRFSYEHYIGPIPKGVCVLHKCDVRQCVNPAHLFLGTNAENMADKVRKGRQSRVVGTESSQAKLTAERVAEVLNSTEPNYVLARRFGCSASIISRIRSGRAWRHTVAAIRANRHV